MIYSYRRVSTDDQQTGPKAQQDAIERWAAGQPTTDFFDDGVSGSVPICLRQEAAKMLAILTGGDTVVVSRLDRLFRSVADAASTIEDWAKRNVTLIAIAEGFDMGTIYGRAMAQMASVFAELERGMIRQRTREALQAKRQRGECVGRVPYGWNREGDKLVENPVEQNVLKRIRNWYVGGFTPYRIAWKLNRLGVVSKCGAMWHPNSVTHVLGLNSGQVLKPNAQ